MKKIFEITNENYKNDPIYKEFIQRVVLEAKKSNYTEPIEQTIQKVRTNNYI